MSVTVPNNRFEHTQSVSVSGILSANLIDLRLAPGDVEDENEPGGLDIIGMDAIPGTDEITFTLSFREPTNGPINLLYRVAA